MKRGLLAAFAAAALMLVPTATAGTVPSLAGESFTAQHTTILSCGIGDFGGTMSFAVSGTATGPYAGMFTETGTVQVAGVEPNGRQIVTALTADFTVSTTTGYQVSGSHVFSLSGTSGVNVPSGTCVNGWNGVSAALHVFQNTLRWTVEIVSPAGDDCTASGPALLGFTQGSPVLNDSYGETFYSDVPAQAPVCTSVDNTPPWFTAVPNGLAVDATSADGAVVNYAVVVADDVDPAPAVTCDPASGSTFAIGDTTVTCTATDAAGNVSAPVSFTVTVRGAAAQIAAGLKSTQAGLSAKQQSALADLEAGRTNAACNVLGAYANQVRALGGKKLAADEAEQLLATDARVQALLGC